MDIGESLRFKYLTNNPQPIDSIKDKYKKNIDCDGGILYIPKIDINRPLGIAYYSDNELGIPLKIIHTEKYRNSKRAFSRAHHIMDTIETLNKQISIGKIIITNKKGGSEVAGMFGHVCGFHLYILIVYGKWYVQCNRGKTNRIVEVLVTTVSVPIDD